VTYGVGNPGPTLGQAQKCGWFCIVLTCPQPLWL
jgi:hypothetical protein